MPLGVMVFTKAISRVPVELVAFERACVDSRIVRAAGLRRANYAKLVHELCDVADDGKWRAGPEQGQ